MSNRDNFSSSVATAETTKKATLGAAQTTFQETINVGGCSQGHNLQTGTHSTFATAVKNANAALIASRDAAARARQASVQAARETLRGTDDLGPT